MVVMRVGELACQRDSYLKSLDTLVVSCVPQAVLVLNGSLLSTAKPSRKGSSKAADNVAPRENGPTQEFASRSGNEPLWEVEFEDTVLFPEGALRAIL